MPGGVSITDIQGLVDPLKQYQFRMIIPSMPVSVATTDTVSFRCTSTTLPGSTVPQVPVDLGGFHLQYNGMRMFSHTWATTLIEDQAAQITRQIGAWMGLIYNQRTGIGAGKGRYATHGLITLFDDPDQPIMTRTLYGLWPTQDPDLPLSFAANNRVDKAIVWSYDFWDDESFVAANGGAVGQSGGGTGTSPTGQQTA